MANEMRKLRTAYTLSELDRTAIEIDAATGIKRYQ
jgi:hypothetical protein